MTPSRLQVCSLLRQAFNAYVPAFLEDEREANMGTFHIPTTPGKQMTQQRTAAHLLQAVLALCSLLLL